MVFVLSLKPLHRTLLEHVDQWQGFQALVNMILYCTGIPGHYPVDETTSSLTLTFWYTLQVSQSTFSCFWLQQPQQAFQRS